MGGSRQFVAMNTVTGQTVEGDFSAGQQDWQAPAVGDWVLVVEG